MEQTNGTKEDTLKRITAEGLEKCLLKITAVSGSAWRLGELRVSNGTARDAIRRVARGPQPAAIRIKIKGDPPFTTAILFDPEDTKHISLCFSELSFCGTAGTEQPDVAIVEIGNILLNALANSILKAFKRTAIPSVPAYFRGSHGAVEEWLGAGPAAFTIISAAFTMQREGRTASAEILAFLPPRLAGDAAGLPA